MLSIKKLPTLSASKIQYKMCFNSTAQVVDTEINKHCPNLMNFCKSFSVLHHYTRKSKNPVSKSTSFTSKKFWVICVGPVTALFHQSGYLLHYLIVI